MAPATALFIILSVISLVAAIIGWSYSSEQKKRLKEVKTAHRTTTATLEKEKHYFKKVIGQKKADNIILRYDLQTLQSEISQQKQLQLTITDLEQKINRLDKKNQDLETKISSLKADIQKKDTRIEELEKFQLKENILSFLEQDIEKMKEINSQVKPVIDLYNQFIDAAIERFRISNKLHSDFEILINAQKNIISAIKLPPDSMYRLPKNPHCILGISSQAINNPSTVKSAQKKINKVIHPDRVESLNIQWLSELFTELAKAVNSIGENQWK